MVLRIQDDEFCSEGWLFCSVYVLGVELTKLQRERSVSTCSEYNELLPTQWIIKYGECDVRLCRADVLKIQKTGLRLLVCTK